MFKVLFLVFFCIPHIYATCEINHFDLWTCALKDACMNKFQLHSAIRRKTSQNLKKPYLLAVEGSQYHKLFQDCDHNKDGCISMIDIQNAGKTCERTCTWRNTMRDLLC